MIVEEKFEVIIDKEKYYLYFPFIDDDFNLSFKKNNLVDESFTVVFNHKINDLVIINGTEQYEVKIDKLINEGLLGALISTRNVIMSSIKECQNELLRKDVDILALFNPRDKCHENRYIFTTEYILENGYYSTKYINAFMYYINEELKKEKKDIFEKNNYSDFQLKINKVFTNINVSNLKENDYGIDKCYKIPYSMFIKILKENLHLI